MFFKAPSISVLRFDGTIGSVSVMIAGLNFHEVDELIEDAFDAPKTKAVFIVINCPGGSPTQAHLMYLRIRQLADETTLPVYAFVEDAATSAGYWLACAADKIFAQPTSMVGSMGIVTSSFGLAEIAKRLGVERRVHATGVGKTRLDPFLPESEDDIVWLNTMQEEMKSVFKTVVKSRRPALCVPENVLEQGDSWVGDKLIEYGLVDGFETMHGFIANDEELRRYKLRPVEKKESMSARLAKMFL